MVRIDPVKPSKAVSGPLQQFHGFLSGRCKDILARQYVYEKLTKFSNFTRYSPKNFLSRIGPAARLLRLCICRSAVARESCCVKTYYILILVSGIDEKNMFYVFYKSLKNMFFYVFFIFSMFFCTFLISCFCCR